MRHGPTAKIAGQLEKLDYVRGLPDDPRIGENLGSSREQLAAGLIFFLPKLLAAGGPIHRPRFESLLLQTPLLGAEGQVELLEAQRPAISPRPTSQGWERNLKCRGEEPKGPLWPHVKKGTERGKLPGRFIRLAQDLSHASGVSRQSNRVKRKKWTTN
jgi:hypothetical protein